MEKIKGPIRTVINRLVSEAPARSLFFCATEHFDGLEFEVRANSPHFGLFIAADASKISDEVIRTTAKALIARGLAYLCTWGPDCERVHDTFDFAALEINLQNTQGVIMTTWHDDESLSEALWFFVHSAFPDESYAKTCLEWIVAGVGTDKWNETLRVEAGKVASQES